MDSEVDIVIVGAGAAGLAAAVHLAKAPVSVLALEARDRIGGRAHTVEIGGRRLDLGCEWLHSALTNPFVGVAEHLGFEIDRRPPHWMRQTGGINFSAADQAAYRAELNAFEDRLSRAAEAGQDIAASTLFDPASPWNHLLDAFSSYYNGDEFDQISTADFHAYEDGEVNWRLTAGYGALISAFGAGVPARLETPVTRIDHSGPRLRIVTPRGELSARAAIVTLPTNLLAAGALAFTPDLPDVRQAAADLPLGLANKVFLHLDEPEMFEADGHLFGDPSRTETGSYALRPLGLPLVQAFLGGRCARELEHEGAGAAAAFVMDELVGLLGSDFRAKARPIAETRWAADLWSGGSYSHALPGRAASRAVLAQTFEGRIAFAGEACSPHAFSTAHGAAQSGRDAADRVLAALAVTA